MSEIPSTMLEQVKVSLANHLESLPRSSAAAVVKHWNSPVSKFDMLMLGTAMADTLTKVVTVLVDEGSKSRIPPESLRTCLLSLRSLTDELSRVSSQTDAGEELKKFGIERGGKTDE